MFTRNDLLDIAVKMEENGKAVYDRALDEVKNKALKQVLQWMAQEEECHQKWFLQQKEIRVQEPEAVGGISKRPAGPSFTLKKFQL